MEAGTIVRTARRRAGLTQAELARRVGLTQPSVARIEGGHSEPGVGQLRRLVEACGLDLRIGLAEPDDADWSVASRNLRFSPEQRARQHANTLAFIQAGRAAMEARSG